ncbi:hypothetical protein HPB48_001631 [Haemaphysalis longicornis]|uniref:Uncharacterized protein n=1 Tax=Haemaphysalis longicornis TaxID=44386 RepID=A0A9J6FXK7_HAELO|nr:hypothetical protein HPB48_001631 [Haemaphysalis longicornis]
MCGLLRGAAGIWRGRASVVDSCGRKFCGVASSRGHIEEARYGKRGIFAPISRRGMRLYAPNKYSRVQLDAICLTVQLGSLSGQLVCQKTTVFNGARRTHGKIQVGTLQAAKSGNAPHSSETNAPLKLKAREGNTPAVPLAIVLGAKRLSCELEDLNVSLAVPDDLELAPLAYLAGYIARACEEKDLTAGSEKLDLRSKVSKTRFSRLGLSTFP